MAYIQFLVTNDLQDVPFDHEFKSIIIVGDKVQAPSPRWELRNRCDMRLTDINSTLDLEVSRFCYLCANQNEVVFVTSELEANAVMLASYLLLSAHKELSSEDRSHLISFDEKAFNKYLESQCLEISKRSQKENVQVQSVVFKYAVNYFFNLLF